MSLYRSLLLPLLFRMDAEQVHDLAMGTLARVGPLLQKFAPKPDLRLEKTVFGIRFPNPVGLAAGFDKNAVALRAWEGLGFGFAEVGTITARAQPGNVLRTPREPVEADFRTEQVGGAQRDVAAANQQYPNHTRYPRHAAAGRRAKTCRCRTRLP